MRTESTLFLDPLLGKPIVLPVAPSHWRNYIVLGIEGFFFLPHLFIEMVT